MVRKTVQNKNRRQPPRVPGGTLTLYDVLWLIVIWSIMSNPTTAHNVLQLVTKLTA